MPKYVAECNRAASTTLAIASVVSSSVTQARRGKLGDVIMGSEATPASAALLWVCGRITAAGTNSAVTPEPLDMADPAFLGLVGENHTVNATFTSGKTIFSIPINQQATFRWVPKDGWEPMYPATSASGFGLQTPTISTGTPAITATLFFEE